MPSDEQQQLRILQAAQGEPAELVLASVDLLLMARPEEGDDREQIRAALLGAAITHWCDESILATVLDIPLAEAAVRLARLRELPVVEPFPARGPGMVNVHESARLELRGKLTRETPDQFRRFSIHAHGYFAGDSTPHAVVEALYHRFAFEPEAAARECGDVYHRWDHSGEYENLIALGSALKELVGSDGGHLPAGLVRGAVFYHLGAIHYYHAQVGDRLEETILTARAALTEYQILGRDWRIAMAHNLLGDLLREQGHRDAALIEQRAALEINQRRVDGGQDQIDLKNLALAYRKIGEVLCEQGDVEDALTKYHAALDITQRLADQYPADLWRQRELTIYQEKVGEILLKLGKLPEALDAFRASLEIAKRFSVESPGNTTWQDGLSVAHRGIGSVLLRQGRLLDALAEFRAALAIVEPLADRYPANTVWQVDLALSCADVADVLLRLPDGDFAGGRKLIQQGRERMERLAGTRALAFHEELLNTRLKKLSSRATSAAR